MTTSFVVRCKKSDLLRLAVYVTLRSGTLRWMTLAVAVMVLVTTWPRQKAHSDAITVIATILTAIVFTLGYLAFVVACTLLTTLLRNRKGSPATEVQTYSLSDVGLVRQSASSDTLLKWGGARSLHRRKSAIYVGASVSSYYILPRHSFTSDEAYDSLWNDLQRLAPDLRADCER